MDDPESCGASGEELVTRQTRTSNLGCYNHQYTFFDTFSIDISAVNGFTPALSLAREATLFGGHFLQLRPLPRKLKYFRLGTRASRLNRRLVYQTIGRWSI